MMELGLLFSRYGFLKVPQLESGVFTCRNEDRFSRMKRKRTHAVEMAAQCVLGIPSFTERFFIHWNLEDKKKKKNKIKIPIGSRTQPLENLFH